MSSDFQQIHALERAWLRNRALSDERLDENISAVYDYAIRLALMRYWSPEPELIVDISPVLEKFRAELLAFMRTLSVRGWSFPGPEYMHQPGVLAWKGEWRRETLVEACPELRKRLNRAIQNLSEAYPSFEFSSVESSLANKKLVLALGGGGGTGFAHLSLFQWLEENNIQPSYISGTSIGALLGCIRALQDHYDAARTVLELPGFWKITRCLQPSFGTGKHGLMGLCRINLESLILAMTRKFGWTKMPSIHELKIPFSCVSSGILMSDGIRESIEAQKPGFLNSIVQFTTHSWRAAFQNASSIAGILSSSQAVIPVEFGLDSVTQTLPVCDAVSFSILIPGVLNYELPPNHYRSLDILNKIFKENGLYRLCDGGVALNVPVETACKAVESRIVGHENVYVLGLDVFAPQLGDSIFYPLEEIANKNAIVSAEYADSFVRLKELLSPVNVAPSLSQLKWQNSRFRKEFADEMKIIVRAMKPLPPLKSLEISE